MKLKIKWKFLKTFFRREDPMKLKIFTFIKIIFNIYFLGKKKNFFIYKYNLL